ncbi:Murein L,D-transpeptidase YafK [Rhizobiales bacterium GAS113]|nr:Murein L,D-transpeptidase YafK [Rhizobiales bacterium GAS113]
MLRMPGRFAVAALAFGLLTACGDPEFRASNARHWVPLTPQLLAAMQEKGMKKDDPVLIRTYKQEAEFEVWKKDTSGRYALLKTFPMCRWSGQLGPKHKEGDRQAPEGYYAITPAQMNPNSNYHLSYDIGYPNAYDRAHGGTGSYLMVHGDCSSAGCYSMTDQQIEEIYALVREAHSGGEKAVQMQAFPFRFTPENLARHRLDPNMAFWRNLKEGADRFAITGQEPKVSVCNARYSFDRTARPGEQTACGAEADTELANQVAEKERADSAEVAALVAKGTPAVRLAYDDGGQNPAFRYKVAETSRPEAISEGPTVQLMDAKGAVTKVALRAKGFDETSIAAAVKDVGSPVTTTTMVATASGGDTKSAAMTVASVGASAVSGGSAATVANAGAAPSNATVIARRDANPANDARTAVTAFAAAPATTIAAAPNKDAPLYQRLLARLPFTGSDSSPVQNQTTDANQQQALDPAAPLPPVRPTMLKKASGQHISPPQADTSPQASLVPGISLFSSHAIFATLPSFLKGSAATAPTTVTGFAPLAR